MIVIPSAGAANVVLAVRRIAIPAVFLAGMGLIPQSATAALMTFFGEDLGAGGAASIPNSLDARNAFLAEAASQGLSIGQESFESFTGGDNFFTNPSLALNFSGTGVTGDLTGGQVRDVPFNARFAISGTNYLDSSQNQRITFSAPVMAFGAFVIDPNEVNNNPALVTIGGNNLTQAEIEARPFDSVDGIFRLITERSPGVFEVLGGAQATFPSPDSSALFIGVVDTMNPLTNVIFINGTAGLDSDFLDGFGYDDLVIGVQRVPEPAIVVLLAIGIAGAGYARKRHAH